MTMGPIIGLVLLASALLAATAEPAPFLAGADLSHLPLMERHGHRYRDGNRAGDAIAILKRHGITCVRLRLWTSTPAMAAADPFNRGNHLDEVLALARRVRAAGLVLLLDFHYSDTWADPRHQHKPQAWAGLSGAALADRVYTYSRDTISAFRTAGAMPGYVQIGNETTVGMLWPDGKVDGASGWAAYAGLVRAAARGIAEGAGTEPRPRTIVHIDRGGDWTTTQWFFDALLREQQVDIDIIGQSYYPWWHGTLEDLRTCLERCVERYGKPVLIAETAVPWATTSWDGKPLSPIHGIPAGPDGQVRFVRELGRIVGGLPGGSGLGVVWWGAELQTTPGINADSFDQRSFWGADGRLLPVARELGALARTLRREAR
jgi:arabinogalactan endo-1,4-beta-galactosidase